jgi:hypothetical protein
MRPRNKSLSIFASCTTQSLHSPAPVHCFPQIWNTAEPEDVLVMQISITKVAVVCLVCLTPPSVDTYVLASHPKCQQVLPLSKSTWRLSSRLKIECVLGKVAGLEACVCDLAQFMPSIQNNFRRQTRSTHSWPQEGNPFVRIGSRVFIRSLFAPDLKIRVLR